MTFVFLLSLLHSFLHLTTYLLPPTYVRRVSVSSISLPSDIGASLPMSKLPVFRKGSGRRLPGRSRGTVVSHQLLRSFLHLIAWIFLVLVMIGNVKDKPVLRDTYFIKIDLSNIVPISVPNASILNSIARTIGLHDFYQVGLWNFCEGYLGSGITFCSKPRTLYYFNPVKILLSELLSGASSMYTPFDLKFPASALISSRKQSPCPPMLPTPWISSKSSRTGCLASSSQQPFSPSF